MKPFKIVLVGGPCGGKTQSLLYFKEQLIKMSKSVALIEETAHSLLSIGYKPNDNISTFDFQNLLFKIQFLKEYYQEQNAEFIICDRGLLDGKIYISNEDYNRILSLNGINEDEIRKTYDLGLYFRTIAYEYPDEFKLNRPYETPDIGKIRDQKSLEVWQDKLLSVKYDNKDGIELKRKKILLALIKHLEQINNENRYNLSDYYDDNCIKKMLGGINLILSNANLSKDTIEKTRRLIK